jgi:hypothetical protein
MDPAVGAGLGIGILIFYLAAYVFFAFCLAKIAEKTGQPFKTALIMALIPIANIILLLQVAAKPLWWIILLIIPIVNIVILAIVWMSICERLGKSKWLGLLMFVPIANLILLLMLAFGGGGAVTAKAA